jgi:two-component system, OmpR family, sensor kinase
MSRFTLKTRLTILVTLAAAVTIAVLTLGFNLLLRSNLNADANRVLAGRAAAEVESLTVRNGAIHVKETPDRTAPDIQVWIYDGSRPVERPPAPHSAQRLAQALAVGRQTHAEDSRADLRLLATPIVQGDRRVGTVVTALSLEPYERTASKALDASLIYALAALLLVVIATRLVVDRALRPVARMTAEAADWSEHDLDHRFNAGEPYDELTHLAATFDSMLARLASSLRHEQLLSAELSHELRTPLAAIVAEADLALRRDRGSAQYQEALRAIASRASQMQRTLETLLAASRGETLQGRATADAERVGEQALAACEPTGADGLRFHLRPPRRPLRVDVDGDTAERILVPLIENGCRYASNALEISIEDRDGAVAFVVADDGPGIASEDAERVFEPGFTGGNGDRPHEGAGLGLTLARRLARAVGGDVKVLPDAEGARIEARIPGAGTS